MPDASDMTVKINGEAPLSEYPYTGKTVTAPFNSEDEDALNLPAIREFMNE